MAINFLLFWIFLAYRSDKAFISDIHTVFVQVLLTMTSSGRKDVSITRIKGDALKEMGVFHS